MRRANRLLEEDAPSVARPSTTSSGVKKKKLTEKTIKFLWVKLVKLAWALLQYVQVRGFLMDKMGKDTIDPSSSEDEGFEHIPVPGEDPKKKKDSKPQPWQVINHAGVPYVVGQELTPGEGAKDKVKITQEPLLCQHPSDKMLARGGRGGQKWWMCQACGRRFERTPLSNFQSAGTCMGGNDLICLGCTRGSRPRQSMHRTRGTAIG